MYVGTQAIAHIHSKNQTPSMSTIAHSSHMDIFQNLAVDLDTEGKHYQSSFGSDIWVKLKFVTSKMGVDCVFAVGFFTSGIRFLFQVGTCS